MASPFPKPFTDTEAELDSQRHIAVRRYKEAIAERVRRERPVDQEAQESSPELPGSGRSLERGGEVWAELAAVGAKATAAGAKADAIVSPYLAALLAQAAQALPKATLVLAISLATFIAFVAVYSATWPTRSPLYSRQIMVSFHGTALVQERYYNEPPRFRLASANGRQS